MAAFLAPWSDVLALDLAYREDELGRHQWLEFCLRPRMAAFVCDLYREDGPGGGDGRLLGWEVDEAYAEGGRAHYLPAAHPKRLSGHRLETPPIVPDLVVAGSHALAGVT
mmetsp:Transcript_23855/g.59134  ORF Transcript_23855/g.59134 Transcript_23855/m.59134 type:complete len:110 (-) Transcript_23855:422-751(-)|eukprot:4532647-Prymnesium_polylepis.1